MKKKDILILIIPIIIVTIIYPFLPGKIPRQFGFDFHPKSYMPKQFLFLVGLLPFVIYKYYRLRRP